MEVGSERIARTNAESSSSAPRESRRRQKPRGGQALRLGAGQALRRSSAASVFGRLVWDLEGRLAPETTWLRVKNRYPKWNPGKWKHGLTPAVPWWFSFDPYPHGWRAFFLSISPKEPFLTISFWVGRVLLLE